MSNMEWDPSFTKAERAQRHFLQPSARSLHTQRFKMVLPYVEGKTVLDIGAACGKHRPDWLHGLVKKVAAKAVAVDILPGEVEALRASGFDAVQGDAQDLHLNEKYDVVLAGELIEHLDNFSGFLRSVRAHLAPGGRLVLTTPNAFCFTNFLYRFGDAKAPVNADHKVWFDADVLRQLLVKAGWEVLVMDYVKHETPGRIRAGLASIARSLLPDRLAWRTLFVVAEPK